MLMSYSGRGSSMVLVSSKGLLNEARRGFMPFKIKKICRQKRQKLRELGNDKLLGDEEQ